MRRPVPLVTLVIVRLGPVTPAGIGLLFAAHRQHRLVVPV